MPEINPAADAVMQMVERYALLRSVAAKQADVPVMKQSAIQNGLEASLLRDKIRAEIVRLSNDEQRADKSSGAR